MPKKEKKKELRVPKASKGKYKDGTLYVRAPRVESPKNPKKQRPKWRKKKKK